MYSTADFRTGLKIELEGKPFTIIEFLHVKPGKGGAFVRTKLKHMLTGQVLEKTFRAGEKVAPPNVQEKEMQYLYQDKGQYCFMDTETFDQVFLTAEQLRDNRLFLKENTNVKALIYNEEVVDIELPNFVELTVAQTEPGIKGNTVTGGTKPATMESGGVIQVPLFVNIGDTVRIDTRTKQYIERTG
ncbi:MAG: elongation factor P [Deltaproteobacteria bacterium]|nr:elongation factor P [Deltaproteobacteria bacterium]MBW2077281.1 elongation factor P [Deltaproteobacteria bacterium]RLB27419.1 MAG: elongation factor P [Deltaproteobacteria bacterium]